MGSQEKYGIVLSTCPDEATAIRIAEALVEAAAAACVNIVPGVRSVYRWQGKLQQDAEWLLIIKTGSQRYGDVEAIVQSLHPYELPEVVAVPIEAGSTRYLAWLADETREKP